MSEYWVSHKRYHCKYCNIYIADDVPSRQHHENGMRHKGNVERFVRGLYKAGEKAVKDRDEEKREMERISKAAAAAYAQDVGAGLGGVGSSSRDAPAAAPAPKKPPTKPSNPYANYSTAASLGYADPDAERAKAEADIRQTMGVAGEWQFVQNYTSASSAPVRSEVPSVSEDANGETAGSSEGDRKREAPVDDIEDERVFKLRKKTVDIGLGELYDPGLIPIKLKVKKEESTEPQPASSKTAVDDTKADAQDALPADAKVKIAWKRAAFQPAADEPASDDVKAHSSGEGVPEVKLEEFGAAKEEVLPAKIESEPQIPPEPVKKEEVVSPSLEVPAPTSLFRKRKLPTRR
ncbi:hypothetical protein DFJ58DRAFT_230961 [Suillus subalutaceus]|uniref:uncharacterized protein n=1 Tax=Suillus subalutaceus TaxID=48586 RepID=UPI001B86700D|nr:uncharacterized protein DFJ58DRAFT_230961 [Suillus subalutaceus]KAG1862498.1 hypothetical protein DFJ58DRAFT_230961 [Suillus subalutaceus]